MQFCARDLAGHTCARRCVVSARKAKVATGVLLLSDRLALAFLCVPLILALPFHRAARIYCANLYLWLEFLSPVDGMRVRYCSKRNKHHNSFISLMVAGASEYLREL